MRCRKLVASSTASSSRELYGLETVTIDRYFNVFGPAAGSVVALLRA
jgi:hypothetical protein